MVEKYAEVETLAAANNRPGTRERHVLLVEDDNAQAVMWRLVHDTIPGACELRRVPDGEAAMSYLGALAESPESVLPCAIILDLRLPRLSGMEVLVEIKAHGRLQTIPVVVLTTSSSETDRHSAYLNRANSFVTKPFDFDSFNRLVRELMIYWTEFNETVNN